MEIIRQKFLTTKREVYNFTITFDPKFITDKQTWETPLKNFITGLQNIRHPRIWDEPNCDIVNYLIVREPHSRNNNARAHLHGQLTVREPMPLNNIHAMQNGIRRMWGRGEFKLNYEKKDVDGVLLSWTDYCLKHLYENQHKYRYFGYKFVHHNINLKTSVSPTCGNAAKIACD